MSFRKIIRGSRTSQSFINRRKRARMRLQDLALLIKKNKVIVPRSWLRVTSSLSLAQLTAKMMMKKIRNRTMERTKKSIRRLLSTRQTMLSRVLKMNYKVSVAINLMVVVLILSTSQMEMASSTPAEPHTLDHSWNRKSTIQVNQILKMSSRLVSITVSMRSPLIRIWQISIPLRAHSSRVPQAPSIL